MSDTLPPLTAVEQMRQAHKDSQQAMMDLWNLLPGMNQGTMNVLLAAHQNMNTPGANGRNLICLPALGVAEGGGDE